MFKEDFIARLAYLRTKKGVSARDMSLSIGQNAGYIHNIESGKALPSMSVFLFICDYLGITPAEFFNTSVAKPERMRNLISQLEKLDSKQFDDVAAIVSDISK